MMLTRARRTGTLAAVLAAGTIFLLAHQVAATVPSSGLEIGDPCPAFEARDLSGKAYTLESLTAADGPTILFFWSLHSAPSIKEMIHLEKIYREHHSRGLKILAIEMTAGDALDGAEILEKLESVNVSPSYPLVQDDRYSLRKLFDVGITPRTFIIDGGGLIISSIENFTLLEKEKLSAEIDRIFFPKPDSAQQPLSTFSLPRREKETTEEAPSLTRAREEKGSGDQIRAEKISKYRYFADFYYQREEYSRALSYYEKCLDLNPRCIPVRLKMGELFAQQKEYDRAREMWEWIIKLEPDNAEADSNLRKLIRGDF